MFMYNPQCAFLSLNETDVSKHQLKSFCNKQDIFTVIFAIASLLDVAQQKTVSTVRIKKFCFIIWKKKFINRNFGLRLR